MQYMLLVYDTPGAWPDLTEKEMGAVYSEYAAVTQNKATKHSAQLKGTEEAKTVRVKDGQTLVTDGPFAETKEQLGGYYLVEAGSIDEAAKLAEQIPSARFGGSIEVRPIVEM
ncbi:MAG: YciI family protein [Actinomycetota bacterium]